MCVNSVLSFLGALIAHQLAHALFVQKAITLILLLYVQIAHLDVSNVSQAPIVPAAIQGISWKQTISATPVDPIAKHAQHKHHVYLVEMEWSYQEPAAFHAISMTVYIALKIQVNKYNALNVQLDFIYQVQPYVQNVLLVVVPLAPMQMSVILVS